jgi:hypothetical protein
MNGLSTDKPVGTGTCSAIVAIVWVATLLIIAAAIWVILRVAPVIGW